MLQRCIQSNNLEIHLLAYKSIILGIIQYSAGVLASMTATQRKKLEKCQRNMINWIYRGCNTDQGEINNVTIDLAKADFNENEESNDETNEINYKGELSKLQLNPLSHRIDRNLILLGANALFDRLAIPQITMKESKTTERLGPFIQTKVKKEPKRPPFFQKLIERSIIETAATMFNKLKPETRKEAHDKIVFKCKLSEFLGQIDVLNPDGIPLDMLKIDRQILYTKTKTSQEISTVIESAD